MVYVPNDFFFLATEAEQRYILTTLVLIKRNQEHFFPSCPAWSVSSRYLQNQLFQMKRPPLELQACTSTSNT